MKSESNRPILWYSFLVVALCLPLFAVTAAAQSTTDPTPREEGESLEENLLYGFAADGRLSLAVDNLATFCPNSAVLAVHPDHRDTVLKEFNAKDVGDGTWEVPDPETGEVVTAKVQYASAVYDDGTADAESLRAEKLPVLSAANIAIVPILWPRCWTLRFNHICGTLGNCGNGLCFNGFRFVQVRNFLVCRRQPGSLCLQFLSPVCRLNRYFCRDCSGPIIATWPSPRWVCAVF